MPSLHVETAVENRRIVWCPILIITILPAVVVRLVAPLQFAFAWTLTQHNFAPDK